MLVPVRTLLKVTGAALQSAPTLVTANHLFTAPFGAQLQRDLDGAAASWPSASLSAELQSLTGDPSDGVRLSDIRAARLSESRPRPGETG